MMSARLANSLRLVIGERLDCPAAHRVDKGK